MNKVITINLNGKAYQLEEHGYEKLHAYLKEVRNNLNGNPDQDEIVKDFEQAIAEKCDKYITAHKNVVTDAEVDTIIADMGPIESDSATTSTKTNTRHDGGPKRLYRIREGAIIMGVCNGLAAYFGVDVILVRILFVIFALFTRGGGIGLYILMAVFVPAAETNEERAFARGKQFNAQEFMEEMKQKYGKYAEESYWKSYGESSKRYATSVANGWISFTRIGTGIFTFIGSVVLGILAALYSFALFELIFTGMIYGRSFPGMSPVLLGLIITAIAYVIILPIRMLVHEARRHTLNLPNRDSGTKKIAKGIIWFMTIGFLAVVATRTLSHDPTQNVPYGTNFWIAHHNVCIGGNHYCDTK